MSIPKVSHYCWFGGGKLDELSQRCIESWKEKLPDYEIKEWNESNFDIKINKFVNEAYEKNIGHSFRTMQDCGLFIIMVVYI